jgi:hypothetical protein
MRKLTAQSRAQTRQSERPAGRGGERGNAIVEFALVAVILIPLLSGLFTVGLALTRSLQVQQVTRNVATMYVKNIPMFSDSSKRLINRLAEGLNMGPNCGSPGVNCNGAQGGVNGYPLPSSTGDGVVYISEVKRIGDPECAEAGFSGTTASEYISNGCTNHGHYAFTQYIPVGNTSLRNSDLGTPVGPFNSERRISPNDVVTKMGNRATGFKTTPSGPGIVYLVPSSYTKVTESFFKVDEISFLINLDMTLDNMNNSGIYARNVN